MRICQLCLEIAMFQVLKGNLDKKSLQFLSATRPIQLVIVRL